MLRARRNAGSMFSTSGNDSSIAYLLGYGLVAVVALYGTVVGAVRAYKNNDTGWLIAIVVLWCLGSGWLAGWIYIATHRKITRR